MGDPDHHACGILCSIGEVGGAQRAIGVTLVRGDADELNSVELADLSRERNRIRWRNTLASEPGVDREQHPRSLPGSRKHGRQRLGTGERVDADPEVDAVVERECSLGNTHPDDRIRDKDPINPCVGKPFSLTQLRELGDYRCGWSAGESGTVDSDVFMGLLDD